MHDEYQPAEDAHAPVGDDRKTGRGRAQHGVDSSSLSQFPQSCLPGVWAGAAVTRGVLGRAAGPLGHARGGTLARSPEYRSTCASRISWSTTGRVLGGRSAGRGTTDLVSEVERGVVALPLWRTRASRSAGAKGERGAGGRLGGRAIRLMGLGVPHRKGGMGGARPVDESLGVVRATPHSASDEGAGAKVGRDVEYWLSHESSSRSASSRWSKKCEGSKVP